MYLLWLHQHMGGNPNDLQYVPVVQCMTIVSDQYKNDGIPSGLGEADREAFQQTIMQTAVLLCTAPSDYPADAIASFKATLELMYADVGGDPQALP